MLICRHVNTGGGRAGALPDAKFGEAEIVIIEGRWFFTEANFALLPYLPMDGKTRRDLARFRCEFYREVPEPHAA